MKLFLIGVPAQQSAIDLMVDACQRKNVPYEILDPSNTNPSKVEINPGDSLCRISYAYSYGCLELEYSLMKPGVTTFYKDNNILLLGDENFDSIVLSHFNIPIPKTINYIPKDRQVLEECINELGGFPIIIKSLNPVQNAYVMRIDSFQSLFSISNYLLRQGGVFVLKEFCNTLSTARLVVLGDKVIDAIEYPTAQDEFRSNKAAESNAQPKIFDQQIQDLAIRATHALGLEFAGVDIIITETGPKVVDINFPCTFAKHKEITGTDIAGQMVDYLLNKSTTHPNQ